MEKFINKLKAVFDFLKYGFPLHIDSDEDCAHISELAIVGNRVPSIILSNVMNVKKRVSMREGISGRRHVMTA